MSCPCRMDVGAYLIDALTLEDRQETTAHLQWCADCRAELADLTGVAEVLLGAAAFLRGLGFPGPKTSP